MDLPAPFADHPTDEHQRLTAQQSLFVTEFVLQSANGAEAARRAGYAEAHAAATAYRLIRLPHVQRALRLEQQRVLGGDLATIGLSVLREILTNPDAPAGVRLDAAKAALDRGGLGVVKVQEGNNGPKSLENMAVAELEAHIMELKRKRAEEANPVIDLEATEATIEADSTENGSNPPLVTA